MFKYSVVPTTELKDGDVIQHYGVTFQLKNRHEVGSVICFDTDCLVYTSDCNFPYHWITDKGQAGYRIQGNCRAWWNRLDPEGV